MKTTFFNLSAIRRLRIISVICLICVVCPTAIGYAQDNNKFVPTQEELDKYLPELKVGDLAPELKANSLDGTTIDLKDMRGSYVIIDFWASWCGDCRREIPDLKTLYADTKERTIDGKQLKWLGFSFDYKAEAWKALVEKEQLPWPQISNLKKTREDPTFNNWKLHWIPAFFIISPDGTIIATAITADGLREAIEKL